MFEDGRSLGFQFEIDLIATLFYHALVGCCACQWLGMVEAWRRPRKRFSKTLFSGVDVDNDMQFSASWAQLSARISLKMIRLRERSIFHCTAINLWRRRNLTLHTHVHDYDVMSTIDDRDACTTSGLYRGIIDRREIFGVSSTSSSGAISGGRWHKNEGVSFAQCVVR